MTHWQLPALKTWQSHSIAHNTVLQEWQQQQLQLFAEQGFPTRQQEDWKYTDVSAIKNQGYQMSPAINTMENIQKFLLADAIHFVFIDGVFQEKLLQLSNLPKQVVLKNMAMALRQQIPIPKFTSQETPFVTLNAGLLTDGLFLSIPDNVIINQPIHLLYVSTPAVERAMQHPRHWIFVGKNSRVQLFEQYVATASAYYFNNVVTEVTLEKGACLSYSKFQDESKEASHVAALFVQQAKDSEFQAFHVSTGAALSREDIRIALQESGARCQLQGLSHIALKQHHDTHSKIEHKASSTSSEQSYKGIYNDAAHGVFNGKIKVAANTEKVVAHQTNKNLLLSATAAIDTKPELEIYAEDVSCSHGATVGQLDAETLFYLQTRGIDAASAENMLTSAFSNEIFESAPQTEVNRYIQQQVVQGCCHE